MFYDGKNEFSDGEDFSDHGEHFPGAKPSGPPPSRTEGNVEDGNNKKKKKSSKQDKGKQKASDRIKYFKKLAATKKEAEKSSFDSPTRSEQQQQENAFSPSSPESSSEPEAFWQEGVPEPDFSPRSAQRDPSGSFRRGTGSVSSSDETGFMGRNRPLSPPDSGPRRPCRSISPVPNEGESPEPIILNTFVEDDDEDNVGRSGSDGDDLTISTDEAKELCKGGEGESSDEEDGNVSESDEGSTNRGLHRSRSPVFTNSRSFSSDSTFDEAFTTGSERSSSSSYEENSIDGSGSGDSSYEERSFRDMEEGRNKNDTTYREIDPQQRRKMTLTLIAVIISWCLVGIIAGGIVSTILKG